MLRNCSYLLALLLTAPLSLSAQVSLENKYSEGTRHSIEIEQKSVQTLTLAGMNIDTKSSVFSVVTTSIGQRSGDGTLAFTETVESLQSETALPGGIEIRFDSKDPDKKLDNPLLEPFLDVLRAACRIPVTIELDRQNQIQRASRPESEVNKLSDAARKRFSSENLKVEAQKSLAFLPDQPVKKGDRWERTLDMDAGDGQILSFQTRYEYAGTVDQAGVDLDKIDQKVLAVTYSVNGNPSLQIKNSDLIVLESTGVILFNREIGAAVSRSSKVHVAGPLTLVFNGAELGGKVDLTIEEVASRRK